MSILANKVSSDVMDVQVLEVEAGGKRVDSNEPYWVLATLAEAWTGLGDEAKSQAYQRQALAFNPPPAQWMVSSTQEQLNKLRGLNRRCAAETLPETCSGGRCRVEIGNYIDAANHHDAAARAALYTEGAVLCRTQDRFTPNVPAPEPPLMTEH
jgi:hypothetical protein